MCLQVGFETEGTAIYDTMCYLKNEVGSFCTLSAQHSLLASLDMAAMQTLDLCSDILAFVNCGQT